MGEIGVVSTGASSSCCCCSAFEAVERDGIAVISGWGCLGTSFHVGLV